MRSAVISTSVLSALASVHAVTAPWQTLVRHQCGGALEILPNTPAGFQVDISTVINVVDAAVGRVASRASCACPTLDVSQMDVGFIGINALMPNSQSWSAQCDNVATQTIDYLGNLIDLNLPNTCTPQLYLSGQGCKMQYNLPEYNIKLAFAMKKCSASAMPQFSVHCNGAGCNTFLQPCASNSDCGGGQTCDLSTSLDRASITYVIAALFQQVGLCSAMDGIGCFQSLTPNPTNDMLSSALTWLAGNVFGSASAVTQLSFCGVGVFSSAPSVALNGTTAIQIQAQYEQVGPTSAPADNATTNGGSSGPQAGAPSQGSSSQTQILTSMSITLNYLEPFTGILDGSNLNVLTAGLSSPAITVTGNGAFNGHYDVLKFTCDKQALFFEGLLRAKMAPLFNSMFTNVLQLLKGTQDCRAGVGPISEPEFLRRFGLWSLYFWLQMFDGSAPALSGPSFGAAVGLVAPMQFQMPSSCNYATWLATGRCVIVYSGLNSLAQMDLTMEIDIGKCAGSVGQMSIELACTGADCHFLLGSPKTCSQDSDCGARATCTDVVGALATAVAGPSGDLLAFMSPTCSSPVTWQRDVQVLVSSVLRQTPPTAGTAKYCTFNPNAIESSSMGMWAVGQLAEMTATGGVMKLPSVEYKQTSAASTVSPSVLATMASLLLSALMLLVF